jgi:hypothetical protein
MAVTDKQKKYLIVGGAGLILLYLLYRYYSANQASNQQSTAAGTAAPDTSASDYASLAGQEQGDIAALQSQEQGDVAGLTSTLSGLTGQEASDVSGLTGTIGGLSNQLQGLQNQQSHLGDQIAGIAMGAQPVSPSTVATHKGGPFYRYYVKVTGHAPPATVQASNFIYEAWKSGVSASALQASSRPHRSSKNTHIKHPNSDHAQKRTRRPSGDQHTRRPPAKTRTRPSGTRK